jgi:phosphoribosylformylglycinamidine synthase
VPDTDFAAALRSYRAYHLAVSEGLILAAHDVSEGGLAVSAAEMAFSMVAGMEIDLDSLPVSGDLNNTQRLFAESSSRILIECEPESIDRIQEIFSESAFAVIGKTEPSHKSLRFKSDGVNILDNEIESLKETWKNVLTPYY